MAKMEINRTVEDYLRSMYRLQMRDGRASNAALAKELSISSAAVTDMVRRLSEQGLIEYEKYQGAVLTKTGLSLAMAVTRRHRLWEVFLIQQLEFDWDEVHDLADQLEHISSDKLIDRLDSFLGNPTHDPHGDPIPTKEGVVPKQSLIPISELEPGDTAMVERVSDEFPELLRYAASVGLSIKARIKVLEKISFDASVRLVADGRESVVSEKLASSVFVSREQAARRRP